MKHKYNILQLDVKNPSVISEMKLFGNWQRLNGHLDLDQYQYVYEGEIEGDEIWIILENLFTKFNIDHPDDYVGRSMSTSDIVILDGIKYYCNDIGWINIEKGKPV